MGVHSSGITLMLAEDYLHPVVPAESVLETHALGGIGLAVLAQEMPVSLSPTASPKIRATALDQKNVPGNSGTIYQVHGTRKPIGTNGNGLQIRCAS